MLLQHCVACGLLSLTCGVVWGGAVVCSGGQLGLGHTNTVPSPPLVDVLIGASHVATGSASVCALMSVNGGVRCWGLNDAGQLGVGSVGGLILAPPTSDVIIGVAELAVGFKHACVLMQRTGFTDSGLRCWGDNAYGQLGVPAPSTLPAPIGSDLLIVTPSNSPTISVTASTSIPPSQSMSSSYSASRSIPASATRSISITPSRSVSPSAPPTPRVVAGMYHSCLFDSSRNGAVKCWGRATYGQLGNNMTAVNTLGIPKLDTINGTIRVEAGRYYTCAVMQSTYGLRCWGQGYNGQLGTGLTTNVLLPPTADLVTGVKDVALGYGFACIIKVDTNGVLCWGKDTYGQLGIAGAKGTATIVTPATATVVLTGHSPI